MSPLARTLSLRPMRAHARSRVAPALLCILAAFGCTADPVAGPPKPGAAYTITVIGDSVSSVGQRVTYRATVTDSTGAAVTGAAITWSVSDTAVLTPIAFSFVLPDFVGMTEGTAVVTARWSQHPERRGALTVRVRDLRSTIPVALGQTVAGHAANGVSTTRYSVALAAGDTIDLMTDRRDTLSNVRLRQLSGSLPLVPTLATFGGRSIFGGIVAPATGSYVFDLQSLPSCVRGTCVPAAGGVAFSVRRAGPIFMYQLDPNANGQFLAAPAGGVSAETLWVQNVGTGRLAIRFTSDIPNLRFDQSEVTVQGGSKVAPPGAVAAGAVPIVFRFDAASPLPATKGFIHLLTDSAAWSLVGSDAREFVTVSVYDPAVQLLARRYVDGITAPPTGPLYAVAGSRIFAIDRSSGAVTDLRFDQTNYQELLSTSDGTVYVHYNTYSGASATPSRDTLSRLYSDGRLEYVMSWQGTQPAAVAPGPNGTLFVAHGGALSSRAPNGTITVLASSGVIPDRKALVYHPADHALYYAQNDVLQRFDLATRTAVARGTVKRFRATAVDAKGRIVGFEEFSGDVVFLDRNANVVARVRTPYTGTTATIAGDTMYGGGPPSSRTNYVWRRMVP